jgi:hypothetical protein
MRPLPLRPLRQKGFYRGLSGIIEVQGIFSFTSDLIYERKTERRNNEKGC